VTEEAEILPATHFVALLIEFTTASAAGRLGTVGIHDIFRWFSTTISCNALA